MKKYFVLNKILLIFAFIITTVSAINRNNTSFLNKNINKSKPIDGIQKLAEPRGFGEQFGYGYLDGYAFHSPFL